MYGIGCVGCKQATITTNGGYKRVFQVKDVLFSLLCFAGASLAKLTLVQLLYVEEHGVTGIRHHHFIGLREGGRAGGKFNKYLSIYIYVYISIYNDNHCNYYYYFYVTSILDIFIYIYKFILEQISLITMLMKRKHNFN